MKMQSFIMEKLLHIFYCTGNLSGYCERNRVMGGMEQAEWTIGLVTSFVVLIVILKSKASIVFRFLVQAVVGGVLIYGMNEFFAAQNLVSIIALNPLTVLTCGFLGIPGVLLLFCIQILSML